MKTAYDRSSMERLLTMPLDARLHGLLCRRIASLVTADGDLRDLTYFVIADGSTTEADIVSETGLSPLVDPGGNRFGTSDAFAAWWDFLARDAATGLWEMIVCVADSGFAFHLIFLPDADPAFIALCEGHER
jgi:hypothetical protein